MTSILAAICILGQVSEPAAAEPVEKATVFRVSDDQRRHWSYQPLGDAPPPRVANDRWSASEIDRFIFASLEARGLEPSPPAEKRTLIRRATFDLTGLPATPEEVEDFLNDDSDGAFQKVVDRLLQSKTYGQRWARHWLDVVRYADGFFPDANHGSAPKFELFEAWRYRDWVVDSFNRDLPFDEFVVHQIAGDRLPSPKGEVVYPDGLVASTFLAIGVWDNGDADKDKVVSDIVDDQIDTIGKAFLGLTLGCSRCHDHKYDPVSQEDYYGLAGIFYSTRILEHVGAKGDHTVALRTPLVSMFSVRRRQKQLEQLLDVERRLGEAAKDKATEEKLKKLTDERAKLQKDLVPEPPLALAACDGGTPGGLFPGVQDVPLHVRGSYTQLGHVVPRRLPTFFAGDDQPPITSGSGRLEVARWVASRDNPLTARVIVNRVWQHHFGGGIVRTSSNFGLLGDRPSHPELLDWLARTFIDDGLSLKKLHRRIMLSAAYRQSGGASPDQLEGDPDNRLFGRQDSRRLGAEAIRDAMLAVTGRLDSKLGGESTRDLDSPRRALYVKISRWDRSDYATLFDAADPEQSVAKRHTSTVAPQALFLLNHQFVPAQARRLLERVGKEAGVGVEDRIRRMYQLLFCRRATADEIGIGVEYVRAVSPDSDAERDGAWLDYAQLLLCSSEFFYID